MSTQIRNKKPTTTPIYALAILGPRAMKAIDRHKSIAAIAVHEGTLGPKVARFAELNSELMELTVAHRKQVDLGKAEIDALQVTTRMWRANLQYDRPEIGVEDIAITETRSADAVLLNASNVVTMFRKVLELSYAAGVVAELESMCSSATEANDAAKAGRVAVQEKQAELQAAGADLHAQLVSLRRVFRAVLGSGHFDTLSLRTPGNRKVAAEIEADDAPDASPDPTAPPSG